MRISARHYYLHPKEFVCDAIGLCADKRARCPTTDQLRLAYFLVSGGRPLPVDAYPARLAYDNWLRVEVARRSYRVVELPDGRRTHQPPNWAPTYVIENGVKTVLREVL